MGVSDNFAMDNVQCNGTEEYIWRCPHETEDNCGGHEGAGVICSNDQGLGPTTTESAPVNVAVLVKDASSNDVVADVSVEFRLGDLVLTETTNYEGVVIFTLGSEVALDRTATIVISREGYISVTIERMIRYGFQNEIFQVFASPALSEGASITLYGETSVEMSVADGDGGDLWWMLGTFEPSVGTSSFSTIDTLQNFDPDTRSRSRDEESDGKGPDGKTP